MRTWPLVLVLIASMTACTVENHEATPSPGFFDYQSEGLSGFEVLSTDPDGLQNLLYQSPVTGMVTAYMLAPEGGRVQYPAVVYLHPSGSGKATQIDEATRLSGLGYVVLLIDSPKVRPEPWTRPEDHSVPNHNRDIYRDHIIDVRRGIDLLGTLPSVDPNRISVIGKNIGGGFAGILSGVEDRIDTFVIQAAIPELGQYWPSMDHPVANGVRERVGQERLEEYARETAVTDALHYVDLRENKRVLYQWAGQDDWLTVEQAEDMVRRTTGDVTSLWYDEGHGLPSDAVINDYIDWLNQAAD